ncbi:hypothetical protein Csa_007634 [Cucumis sativus]|nr:hypothetical protein Csa_007634 [Cucumis sativus]
MFDKMAESFFRRTGSSADVNSHGGVYPIVWFLQEEEQCAFLCQEGPQVSKGAQKGVLNKDGPPEASSTRKTHSHQCGEKGCGSNLDTEQAELVSVAINEGFNYHHAEAGYVMLTYWIPDLPSMLPSGPSHHIGVATFPSMTTRGWIQCSCFLGIAFRYGFLHLLPNYVLLLEKYQIIRLSFRNCKRRKFELLYYVGWGLCDTQILACIFVH